MRDTEVTPVRIVGGSGALRLVLQQLHPSQYPVSGVGSKKPDVSGIFLNDVRKFFLILLLVFVNAIGITRLAGGVEHAENKQGYKG